MKKLIANFAVLGVTGVVFLVLAEIVLRLFPSLMPEEARLRLHWRGVAGPEFWFDRTVNDPEIGFLYQPNDTETISRGDFSFVYQTDNDGFRNSSSAPESADLVILGDSMAFGYGVGEDATWSAQLQEEMPEHSIHNLAMIGSSPQQYLRIWERFGTKLSPQLVILMIFPGNDIGDAQIFQRWQNEAPTDPYLEWRTAQRATSNPLIELLDRSYLVNFLRGAKSALEADISNRTITFDTGERLLLSPSVYAQRAAEAVPGNENFELVVDIARRTQESVISTGAELLVVLMPTKEEVYLPTLGETPPDFNGPMAEALDDAGLNVLDLTPIMIEAAMDGAPLYFEVDGHPNERGYEVVADAVQNRVAELTAD